MLSAVIPAERGQPAVHLAVQLAHQRFVRPGPLVLGTALRKSLTRAADRDRTVSRRSKPSSRTALMGEQPNPWDLLQPQDATSRHRGAKPSRRYGLLGKISLLDRKSTRLNSSHANISYAVFCLKKKNKPKYYNICCNVFFFF